MKNREKFRDLIYDALIEDTSMGYNQMGTVGICRVVKEKVFPYFSENENCITCNGIDCSTCSLLLTFWLDEEYEEPKVDWNKVPIDTLVRVKNDKEEEAWTLRYFCEFDGDTDRKYRTFPNGRTSKTATYYIENWMYCELVEVEDE